VVVATVAWPLASLTPVAEKHDPTKAPVPVAALAASAETPSPSASNRPSAWMVASVAPRTFVEPNTAEWMLHPGSRAELVSKTPVLTLRLRSGALTATVEKSSLPESFLVEVGEARVAVHGTKFTVVHLDDGFSVEVAEGVVSVRREDAPLSEAARLIAPARARYDLQARSLDVPKAARQAGSPEAKTSAAPQRASSLGPGALTPLLDVVRACFAAATPETRGVVVRASTTVSAQVAPNGQLLSVSLNPPLSPAVEACIDQRALALRFAAAPEGWSEVQALALGESRPD
jgi:hypothetical protein